MSIWVAGEVLVDLIPDKSGTRHGVIGGGSANAARALAKLGLEVEFIDGISTDQWGQQAKKELSADGVGLNFVNISEKPTCQAIVTLEANGSASYEFVIGGTATFDFADWLPDPERLKPELLYIGTLVTVIEPSASILREWAMQVSEFAPVVFDPNVRPAVMGDRANYITKVEKFVEISSVVKVSEEDLNWLFPGENHVVIAKKWLELGPALIVITRGFAGLIAVTPEELIEVPGVRVDVVDTIGAGDTVGAIVCEAVIKEGIHNLHGEQLRKMLERAALAAAITCSRKGPVPPTSAQIRESAANAIYR